ncbi:MAG: hypothetical protein AABY65_06545 [Nitrospirota bacterium]
MRIAVIGTPASWETDRLSETIRSLAHEAVVIPPEECSLCLHKGQVTHRGQDLALFDAILVQSLGDVALPATRFRVHILRHLEREGVRVFPKPDAIESTMDRYRMTLELSQAGLPVPPTLVTEQIEHALLFLEAFGPSVFKPLFTSGGRGMAVLADPAEARGFLRAQADTGGLPFYLQQCIEDPTNHMSVVIVGGRFLCAYTRPWAAPGPETIAQSLSSSTHRLIEPSTEEIALARCAARLFGLGFATIEMVDQGSGLTIYGVSPWGNLRCPWEIGAIDAAGAHVAHVLEQISAMPIDPGCGAGSLARAPR